MLDDTGTDASLSGAAYWQAKLHDAKVLLDKIDQALAALSSQNITSYSIDTGQDHQTVTRRDISSLKDQREALLCQIDVLESRLGLNRGNMMQAVPLW